MDILRLTVLFAACGWTLQGATDLAYDLLRAKDYDKAVSAFLAAIDGEPQNASLRKDLAYTYLKIGENELARSQFRQAIQIDPEDSQASLEYAFLCDEAKLKAEARRIFDRVRKKGSVTAERAFQNIDAPLAAGIARWQKAIELGSDTFSSHFELAGLAEQRDELELAAAHYERAWQIEPARRSVLVDLGRAWKIMGRTLEANAALLAASRGGEPRTAEAARELLPGHYPYVDEFRRALRLDPGNVELRREMAYLLLRMDRQPEAETEFRYLTDTAPSDLLSATQLGFLLYARGERAQAQVFFDRVLAGNDEDLANRVRAVLRIPQLLRSRPPGTASIDAKLMAERSIKAGYLQDALKYLRIAHEVDPGDFPVMLKMGWMYNALKQDPSALGWFNLARKSPDSRIASEADRAWRGLRPSQQLFRTSVWVYPMYSTRHRNALGYGQIKTEMRTDLPLIPYASARFVGDSRPYDDWFRLSEKAVILAVGIRSVPWKRMTFWAEAGWAVGYANGHVLPDYRGGLAAVRGFGHSLLAEHSGWFGDTALDAVFVSRFGNDFLIYNQTRAGYTVARKSFRTQLYWVGNLTADVRSARWANFGETGLGIRYREARMPRPMFVTCNLVRGIYPQTGVTFRDFRVGGWYAFSF